MATTANAHAEHVKAHHPFLTPKAGMMDGRSVERLRTEKLAASRATFARLLKVSENTVFRWETGKVKPDPRSNGLLIHLERVAEVLLPSTDAGDLRDWLEEPNRALENFRPIDLVESELGRRKLTAWMQGMGIQAEAL